MTDREKALAIYCFTELSAVKWGMGESYAAGLALSLGEHVGIPEELVEWSIRESHAFDSVTRFLINWLVIDGWLARRALKKGRTNGALTMTNRETAIVLNGIARVMEEQWGKPSGALSGWAEWAASKLRTEWRLVSQLCQETLAFNEELWRAVTRYNIQPSARPG